MIKISVKSNKNKKIPGRGISAHNLYLFYIFFVIINNNFLSAQNLIQDTLFISFQKGNEKKLKSVSCIIDRRNEDSCVLGKYEIDKWLFIPVDLYICTKKPLPAAIMENMLDSAKNEYKNQYILTIDEFKLDKKSGSMIYPHYLLNASVGIYKDSVTNGINYLGHLSYEITARKPFFNDKLQSGFEKVIYSWQKRFIIDFLSFEKKVSTGLFSELENYHSRINGRKSKYLCINLDFSPVNRGKMIDGEIFFYHQEANKKFYRNSRSLRYRKFSNFESIEYGLSNDNLYYRLSPKAVFRMKSLFMLGVNQWKNLAGSRHKIYDAFIIDYSLSQIIQYNNLNKSSIILGIGFMENIYYIYSMELRFDFGILFELGIKL